MKETYEFSFERGQFVKVIGGLLSLVLLVFCAGFLTGIALQMREPAPTLVAQATQAQPQSSLGRPAPALVSPPSPPVGSDDTADAADAAASEATVDADQPAAVQDKPAITEPDPPAQPDVPGRFAVQFGAFLRPENAEVLAKRLEAKGYDADVVEREDSHGRTWYLVRYGIFPNRAEASAVALEIKTRENLDALVRPSNSM